MVFSKLATFVRVLGLSLRNGIVKLTKPAEMKRLLINAPRDAAGLVIIPFLALRAAVRKFTP